MTERKPSESRIVSIICRTRQDPHPGLPPQLNAGEGMENFCPFPRNFSRRKVRMRALPQPFQLLSPAQYSDTNSGRARPLLSPSRVAAARRIPVFLPVPALDPGRPLAAALNEVKGLGAAEFLRLRSGRQKAPPRAPDKADARVRVQQNVGAQLAQHPHPAVTTFATQRKRRAGRPLPLSSPMLPVLTDRGSGSITLSQERGKISL
jgi:hypothetical protein